MNLLELKRELVHYRVTRERGIDLAVGLFALVVLEFVARTRYRPYIYANEIFDFHIADTLGNTLGTVAAVFVFLAVIGRGHAQHAFVINVVTLGLVLFELAHPLLGKPIDPWDILATVLTGAACHVLYRLLHGAGDSAGTVDPA